MREIVHSQRDVQHGGQQNASDDARDRDAYTPRRDSNPRPFRDNEAEAPERRDRDERGRVGLGNQIARKYPKPALDDARVQQQLGHDREQIISDRGGRDRLSTIMLSEIDRFVVLGLFLQSWEQLFLRSGFTTAKGRVRSGYAAGYLATLDRYVRLAQQIGATRVAHDIGDMSLQDLLNSQQAQDQGGNAHDEAPDADGQPGKREQPKAQIAGMDEATDREVRPRDEGVVVQTPDLADRAATAGAGVQPAIARGDR